MVALRRVTLDDVGDPDAPLGSLPWALAVKMELSAALKDERSSARSLERWRTLFIEHRGFAALANADGTPFASFAAFCAAPTPYGLGYDPEAISAIIEERKSIQIRAAEPKLLMDQGANQHTTPAGCSLRTSKRGGNAEYLTARIARDRPDILARMQAGDFASVAAAARAAGIPTGERKSVRIDDPAKVAAFLAKHFEPAEIRTIAADAIALAEGRD